MTKLELARRVQRDPVVLRSIIENHGYEWKDKSNQDWAVEIQSYYRQCLAECLS